VHTGAEIISVHKDEDVVVDVAGTGPVTGERLLVATGRRPDLAGLGAATIGVDETARALPTDEHMRVTDGVWAIGDVTGHGAFTHMSMYEAFLAVDDILGRSGDGAQYHAVPRVTFTDPEVGAVGMTEEQARQADVTVRSAVSPLPESTRGWIHGPGNAGFIKLVEDAERGVLVGATSVGPSGGEVLGVLTLAVHARIPTHELRRMIYAYPTFHRAIEPALDALRQ
jgi:pyruvate/2-oxoglutarate dehydrogenase complex dihydrolipoamide dehydrogenase (E3) component